MSAIFDERVALAELNDKKGPPKKRTKTGCLVCRRRRIKCGEEKPTCRNCAKTKRVCEQPPPLSSRSSHSRRDARRNSEKSTERESESPVLSAPLAATTILPDTKFYEAHMQPPLRSMDSSESIPIWDNTYTTADCLYSPEDLILQPPSTLEGEIMINDFLPQAYVKSPRIEIQRISSDYSELSTTNGLQPLTAFGTESPESAEQSLRRASEQTRSTASCSPPTGALTSTDASRPQGTIKLTTLQSYYLKHFVQNVNMNFTAIIEMEHEGNLYIKPSNFWSYTIPSMAVRSIPLIHALLAISALHEANVNKNTSEHQALLDYHQSIRKLAKALQLPGAEARDDLLATCLVLAYFETMSGETVKWGRHLQGACDLVRGRIMQLYSNTTTSYSSQPTVLEHLIWFHIHQDTIQALLSGNGLFLDLMYIEMVPLRSTPGTITYASDQLRVLLARVGDFACKDRLRKENQFAGLRELTNALSVWSALFASLQSWSSELNHNFTPTIQTNHQTPAGTAITYKHPTIASLQMMYHGAVLYMHRCHPELSAVPAEAIRMSAGATYTLGRDIFRMMTGVMIEAINNRSVDQGSHLKAMINGVLPVFLAGIAVQEEVERTYIEKTLLDMYSLTGWRTVARVLQGLDVAWHRSSAMYPTLTNMNEEEDETVSLQTQGVLEQRYIMVSAEKQINKAVGVLGKLQLSDPDPSVRGDPDHIGNSRWGLSEPIMQAVPYRPDFSILPDNFQDFAYT